MKQITDALAMSDLFRDTSMNLYAKGIGAGIDAERAHWFLVLDGIFAAYRKALCDEKTTMPTPLHLAISNAMREVGDIRDAQAAAKKAEHEEAYAEHQIRRDQRQRYEGRDDGSQDVDLVGRALRAGM